MQQAQILSAKILFTPNTSCERRVIQRANRTFAVAGTLVEWSQSIITCSDYLLQNDTRSSVVTVSGGGGGGGREREGVGEGGREQGREQGRE